MILVHPDFRRRIKIDSARNNMSILDFSKELSKKKGGLLGNFKDEESEEDKPKFGFRI